MTGTLDEPAFARAFDEMIRRQPVLRTSFEPRGTSAVQRIHASVDFTLFPAEDLSPLPDAQREARLALRLDELTGQTFDLQRAALQGAPLPGGSAGARAVLHGPPHHLGRVVLRHPVRGLSSLCGAFSRGLPAPRPELPFTYGDFAAWHRDWCAGEEFAAQLAFWRSRLDRLEAALALPTDRPRRPGMSEQGRHRSDDDRSLSPGFAACDRPPGRATLFLTTLAAYSALLHGYAGQERLVIGTPVRGRNAVELEPIMGYFNNLVPLAIDVDPGQSFLALLERVKSAAVESFASPDVPLEQLAGELAVRRGAGGGSLLYQALFSFQDARRRDTRWGDLVHEVVPLFQKGATEDLGLWFVESERGLHGGVTYNTDILDRATARELRRLPRPPGGHCGRSNEVGGGTARIEGRGGADEGSRRCASDAGRPRPAGPRAHGNAAVHGDRAAPGRDLARAAQGASGVS
ncbi:MAG: hypothetical protein IPJ28_12020 [Betaproteobacteria bacterium]|nr:hypothetical protein [Betaproteobacteria bacterium]